MKIIIGTRGSKLALWQAKWVKSELETLDKNLRIEVTVIKTKGDKILDVPLAKVGGKGLFVKEIETALLDGRIDIAVHSMKDMPAQIPQGLYIGAVPKRENPKDVLISKTKQLFVDLDSGARIGTSSLRRSVQLRAARPDLVIHPLRGNIDTRLKKLFVEDLDAIVLAAAGVIRMDLTEHVTQYLDESIMLPAVGQGALCIEVRESDARIRSVVSRLDDYKTRMAVLGERAFLSQMEGSCQIPIAAHGVIDQDKMTLTGLIADLEGTTIIQNKRSGPVKSCGKIGFELAGILLADGGKSILEEIQLEMSQNYER